MDPELRAELALIFVSQAELATRAASPELQSAEMHEAIRAFLTATCSPEAVAIFNACAPDRVDRQWGGVARAITLLTGINPAMRRAHLRAIKEAEAEGVVPLADRIVKPAGCLSVQEACQRAARILGGAAWAGQPTPGAIKNKFYRVFENPSSPAFQGFRTPLPPEVAQSCFSGERDAPFKTEVERGEQLLKLLRNGYVPIASPNSLQHERAVMASWTRPFKPPLCNRIILPASLDEGAA